MKGLKAKVISMAFVFVLALTTATSAYASSTGNTQLIKRNETIEGYTEVSKNTTSSFNLSVKRADDEFDVYQLTEITWTTEGTVDNASIDWVAPIKEWIADSSHGFTDAKYKTPAALGAAEDTNKDGVYEDESSVINLLRAIREDKTLMAKLAKVASHTGDKYNEGNSSKAPGTVTPTTTSGDTGDVFGNGYTISDMPFGLFFVDAKGGTRTYQPVMIDFIPEQVGPTGHWYIKNDQNYTLKYENVGISKTINSKKSDVLREGEIVDFGVEMEIPAYQKNGENYQYTLLNAFDDMAQGYTLIPSSAVINYVDKAGNKYHPTANMTKDENGNITVKDSEGTYEIIMVTEAYVYYSTSDEQNIFFGTKTSTNQVQFWGLVNGYLEKIGAYLDQTSSYQTVINSYNNKLSASNLPTVNYSASQIKKRSYTKSLITMKFDYTKLMDTLKNQDTTSFVPYKMTIDYSANVNGNSYVGNDKNTNDVYMYYVEDSAGNVGISQDEVVGWTYAANIVKVDGDTYQKTKTGDDSDGNPIYADPTYLKNAIFDLYRKDIEYCGGNEATAVPSENDYNSYSFYKDTDDSATYEAAKNAWAGDNGLLYKAIKYHYASTLDTNAASSITTKVEEMKNTTGDYKTLDNYTNKYAFISSDKENLKIVNEYILPDVTGMTYQYVPVKVDNCDNCDTPHYHVETYVVYMSNIKSTDTKDGVTVVGLDPNKYLLVENTAPDKYNKLSEAIQFEIKLYGSDKYEAAGKSYKGFISDENKDCTNGVYDIVVQNFKGLLLPSTGGMGTLLFTLIGVIVMAVTITIVVVRNKKRQSELL